MSVVLLTGPAAAGKNTISHLLARKRQKCAVIDVDLVRWMYLHPHRAPWEGEEGQAQRLLGVENACLLAKNFAQNNIDVIVLDVLVDETARVYKQQLHEYAPLIVLLLPTFEEAYRRFTERGHSISVDQFALVYRWQEALQVVDYKIDNTLLSAEDVAQKVDTLLEAAHSQQ